MYPLDFWRKKQIRITTVACFLLAFCIAISFCDGIGLFFIGPEIERKVGFNASYLAVLIAPFATVLFLLKGGNFTVSGLQTFILFFSWVLFSSFFSTNDPQGLSFIRTLTLVGFALAVLLPINLIMAGNALSIYRSASFLIINISFVCMVIQAYGYFIGAEGFAIVQPIFSVGIFPRFSGAFGDPNRCGIFFALLLFLNSVVIRLEGKKILLQYFIVPVLMIVLTLSRTGIIVALFFWVYCLCIFPSKRFFLISCVLIVSSFLFYSFIGLQNAFDSDQRSESNAQHLDTFLLGMNSIFYSSFSPIIGNGWGTSYAFVGDIFDDSRYGNFHSGMVTILSSFGIPFLVIFSVYMLKICHFSNKITSYFILISFLGVNLIYDFLPLGIFSMIILASIICKNRRQQC